METSSAPVAGPVQLPPFDEAKMHDFVMKMLGDVGAAISGALLILGDRLGLYRALAENGSQTPAELAERTGTSERYVREWLANQAASGYVEFDPATQKFTLPREHVPALADEHSPVLMCGLYQIVQTLYVDEPKIAEAFRTGSGVGWHEHDHRLFSATERFFRPGYNANIVAQWLPALDGVVEKLQNGAKVADIGCGLGTSTILMARAFPTSTFYGFDYHEESVEAARRAAEAAGLSDRVRFAVAPAKNVPGHGYDLICAFDCIHDMGDPVGALAHVREVLAPDGTFMMVEPFAHDKLEENLNPVGRIFYGASTILCTPASLSQEVGAALGAQSGEARMRDVAREAGMTRFRRAAETPFNLVYELRP
jgi:SAM-dependent methyltransferase